MDPVIRTEKQLAAALRRRRKQAGLTQDALGSRTRLRQATISKLEDGAPATRLSTLMAVLAALDLELVLRDRTKSGPRSIEDAFA
jgi:HTH-type transcriptional regulator / antitoxin HipB